MMTRWIGTRIALNLGRSMDRCFYPLPAVVAGALLQQAVQGRCTPLPGFRRLGVRNASVIVEDESPSRP